MYATNFFEEKMLNLMRGESITAPQTMYLALFQSNPSDAGTGTEASYTGYSRMPITFRAPYAQSSGSNIYVLENSVEISFPEASASGNSITHVAVMDNVTGGNMWLYGELALPLAIQAGVTPVFRVASLQWTWEGNISVAYKQKIMNTLRGVTCANFTPYVGLCDNVGNEFNGTNYARFSVSMTEPAQNSGTGVAYSSNASEILSPTAGNAWGILNIIKIFDAATSGNQFASVTLPNSYNITTGSAVGFHAGALTVNIN